MIVNTIVLWLLLTTTSVAWIQFPAALMKIKPQCFPQSSVHSPIPYVSRSMRASQLPKKFVLAILKCQLERVSRQFLTTLPSSLLLGSSLAKDEVDGCGGELCPVWPKLHCMPFERSRLHPDTQSVLSSICLAVEELVLTRGLSYLSTPPLTKSSWVHDVGSEL